MITKILSLRILLMSLLLAVFSSCSSTLETKIEINAPQAKVWEIFFQTNSYGEWNPMIKKLKGEWKKGSILEVELQQPGRDPMVFKPIVTTYQNGNILEWEGTFISEWIFTGKHSFELESISNQKTIFKQSETFRGMAVPFFNLENTKKAFEMMNEALKRKVEMAQ